MVLPPKPSPSDAARMLKDLLLRWPRRVVCRELFSGSDPLKDLLTGALERRLAALRRQPGPDAGTRAGAQAGLDTDTGPVCFFDAAFPELLRHIPDPPLLLYVRGDCNALDAPCVAVVGARRCTTAGRATARSLSEAMAAAGITVVSGLAAGIDGCAHQGALQGNGRTVAFLGCGLDRVYPRVHTDLARRVVAHGAALISEYPVGCPPLPRQFPERNRLISGVSHAVVVVEADDRSGSLITARLALEQGRDVLAVPGPVGSRVSRGCHRLIQQGAGLVTCADDVLSALGLNCPEPVKANREQMPPDQAALYAHLSGYPITVDELCMLTGWPVARVVGELTCLELAGFVRHGPDGYIASS